MKLNKTKAVSIGIVLATALGLTTGYIAKGNDDSIEIGSLSSQKELQTPEERKFENDENGIYESRIYSVATNEYATYAVYQNIDGSTEIRAWGYNNYGLLGNGDSNEGTKLGWAESAKVDLDFTGKTFKMIESLNDTTFVVLTDDATGVDEIWAWGNNDQGQLFLDSSSNPIVTTPTRILEDEIYDYMHIVGVDASVGSTIIYAEGKYGLEYDPDNYNGEDLYIIGAGDTSKGQDPNGLVFTTGMKTPLIEYIDSDASDSAYVLAYEEADAPADADTQIIAWGDNSNNIMGQTEASDTAVANITFDDEYIQENSWGEEAPGDMPKKVYDVSAGQDNFYFLVNNTGTVNDFHDIIENEDYREYIYATGSKDVTREGSGTYTNGANLIETHTVGGSLESPVDNYSFGINEVSAGSDFLSTTVARVVIEGSAEVDIYAHNLGSDVFSQIENGNGDLVDAPTEENISDYGYMDFLYVDDYVWEPHKMTGSDSNKHANIIQSNEKRYFGFKPTAATNINSGYSYYGTLDAMGSNSNGMFDKYSTDSLGNQESYVEIGSNTDVNYENIKFDVVEGSETYSTVQFTVDTSNDSGMINPNSYNFNLYDNNDTETYPNGLYENIRLVSMDGDGLATYELNGLEKNTEYNLSYTFDSELHDAISFSTTEANTVDPTIISASIDTDPSWDDSEQQTRAILSWEIQDNAGPDDDASTLQRIEVWGDVTNPTSEYGDQGENILIYGHNNPDWKESDEVNFGYDNDYEGEYNINAKPGSIFTNMRVELYANNSDEPIIFNDVADFELPGLLDWSVMDYSSSYAKEVSQNSVTSKASAGFSDAERVEGELELTGFELISYDSRIKPEDIEISEPSYASYDDYVIHEITFNNLTPGTEYEGYQAEISWNENISGNSYSQVVDFKGFTTSDWETPPVPMATLEGGGTTGATTANVNWAIEMPEPTSEEQSPIKIEKLEVVGKKTGYSDEIDFVADGTTVDGVMSGTSTISGLEAETNYDLELVVYYSDVSGGNKSVVESNVINITTTELLAPLQPVIYKAQPSSSASSIVIAFGIEIPKPEEHPDNEPTELTGIKVYFGDDTTPVAETSEEDLIDTDGNGVIEGIINIDGLEADTDYTWHIEVESNAELVVGSEVTTTTRELSPPEVPTISTTEPVSLVATDDYDVFKFNYVLEEEVGTDQSPAYLSQIEFLYNGEVLGEQDRLHQNILDADTPFHGSFDVRGLDWQEDIEGASLRVSYYDTSGNLYTEEIEIVDLASPDYNITDVEPKVEYARVETNGTFAQVSQTEASISYAVTTPPVTLGDADVDVKQIKVIDGTGTELASTTDHKGSLLVTGLTAGTTYSDLQLEVDYDIVRPENDSNAGEVLSAGLTKVTAIDEFTTLNEDEFILSSNIIFNDYTNGDIEATLNVFDSNNVFIPENFRISVVEGIGEDAVRVEKDVDVTLIENTRLETDGNQIGSTSYKVVIHDIQEGQEYTSWKYTTNIHATFENEEDWISFAIEDPQTGNDYNQFWEPAKVVNYNIYYFIGIIATLALSFVSMFIIFRKKTAKEDVEDSKKSTKGGK